MKKDKGSVEKKYFLKYVGLFLNAREEALNSFKSNVCPIKMLDKLDKILTLKTNYPWYTQNNKYKNEKKRAKL